MTPQTLYDTSLGGHFVIAGPCALEDLGLALEIGAVLAELSATLELPVVFKSSFDKANRSSVESFRGPGLAKGLEWLARIKEQTGLCITTDVHETAQVPAVAEVADVVQIPAFLCRQTDLLLAVGQSGQIVNIKKGQFLAPWDMQAALNKVRASGNNKIWLTERGSSFGYNNLVVDFRSLQIMSGMGVPVVFDATHSVQLPGGLGNKSGGQREFVPLLSRAAAAAGCSGVFLEVHPNPDRALCDGPNSWPLDKLEPLLRELIALWNIPHAC